MRNILYNSIAAALLVALLISCGGNAAEGQGKRRVVEIARVACPEPAVPALGQERFASKVNVEFSSAGVELSALPEGVTLERGGRDIMLRSHVPGVEYVVGGNAGDASLTIASDFSPLVTLDGLSLTAHGRNALQVSSKEYIFVHSNGASLSDVAGEDKADSQSAVVKLMGRAVLCGGNMTVKAGRRSALFCTDTLYIAGMHLSLAGELNTALLSNSSIVLSGGAVNAVSVKDVVKCKNGDFVMLGGSLDVNSQHSKADGIQARNIYIRGGSLTVGVTGAAADGIKAKGNLGISGGNVAVAAHGGALFNDKKSDYSSASCVKCNAVVDISGGNCNFTATGDGTKGISCDSVLIVSGGNVRVATSGGDVVHEVDVNAHASSKGIKSDGAVYLIGGNIEVAVHGEGERSEGVESKRNMYIGGDARLYVYAYDDALNAAAVTVAGGRSYLYSVANDAADSNGTLEISGGTVVADGSSSPEQGVDVDDLSLFTITGGTLVSAGGSMGPFPALPLGCNTSVPVAVWSGVSASKGEYISLAMPDGKTLYSYRLARGLERGAMLVASSEIRDGGSYLFALTGAIDGASYCGNGLYAGGVIPEASVQVPFKAGGAISCVAADGSVTFLEPGEGVPHGIMPPPPPPMHHAADSAMRHGAFPPPPPHMAGGAMPKGAFPPPPPVRRTSNGYGAGNLPNYDGR